MEHTKQPSNKQPSIKGCLTTGIISLVLLELIVLLFPGCREAELLTLAFLSNGALNQYLPPSSAPFVTSREPVGLSVYNDMLYASVIQMVSDDHSYLFNTHTGALQTITGNGQDVLGADQSLYFTYRQDTLQASTLTALRRSDNTAVWHHTFDPSPLSYNLQLQNGILFFASAEEGGTGPSVLYAFSERSGAMLWHYIVPQSNGFFYTVSNDSVFILGVQGIEALSITDGRTRWVRQEDTGGQYTIVADNVNVYTVGERIQALRISDGRERWTIGPDGAPYPYLYKYLGMQAGMLYISDDQNGAGSEVRAIRVQDGKILWYLNLRQRYPGIYPQQNTQGAVNLLSFTGSSLYWMVNNQLYAFRGSDGRQSWHFRDQFTPSPGQNMDSQILTSTDGITYIQMYNDLVALQSSNGHKLWTILLPALFDTKAVVDGSTLFYSYAVHISNVPPPPHFVISAISAFSLYQCQNTVHLFALQGPTGMQQWHKQYTLPCNR